MYVQFQGKRQEPTHNSPGVILAQIYKKFYHIQEY